MRYTKSYYMINFNFDEYLIRADVQGNLYYGTSVLYHHTLLKLLRTLAILLAVAISLLAVAIRLIGMYTYNLYENKLAQ